MYKNACIVLNVEALSNDHAIQVTGIRLKLVSIVYKDACIVIICCSFIMTNIYSYVKFGSIFGPGVMV